MIPAMDPAETAFLPEDPAAAVLTDTVALRRDDAEDLVDLLHQAGALLVRLAGDLAAQAAYRELSGPAGPGLEAFAFDLLVAAADLIPQEEL
ncbi:hypothetical protein [Frankia sp. CiP3]|uniref:hypothetical protein n=1 Tax=Frankia sp. CiP3 TaxID=2880971 RepID=UPI001EF68E5D|nr:hypothetical protein [Frankia sp. CiP3]